MENVINKKRKRRVVDTTFKTVLLVLLTIYTITIFAVLIWALISTFKSADNFENWDPLGFPSLSLVQPSLQSKYYDALKFGNYLGIFKSLNGLQFKISAYYNMFGMLVDPSRGSLGILDFFGNTLYIAFVCSLVNVFVIYTASYCAAKYKFKFSGFIYFYIIMSMSIPIVGNTPATLKLLMDLNLYSSHLGMLIMRANMNGMYFLVFYAFFEGLPDSYMEAAEIDGAGQFSIFTKIVIPLGIKMVLTVTLLLFVQNWNDYSINFIYMPTVPTMSYVLYKLVHDNAFFSQVADKTVPTKFAACFILVAPIIILFIIFKDKMMGNISAGGLKG